MGRTPCCNKIGLKKGPWTPEEDQALIDYIQQHGHGRWRTLPKNAGLQRCGKSCRLRWTNYLRPDIKRGKFSFEEEESIIQLHSVLGNKWSAIAARLPGRTDNEIKNYWNTHIRKRLIQMGIDPVTHNPRLDLLDLSSFLSSSMCNSSHQFNDSRLLGIHQPLVDEQVQLLSSLATNLLSSETDQNQDFFLPDLQEYQLSNSHIQNQFQFQPNQIQELQACSSSTTTPFSNDQTQLVIQPNVENFLSNPINFCQNQESNLLEDNVIMPSNLLENMLPVQDYGYYNSGQSTIIDPLFDYSNFQYNNSVQNFSNTFGSVISTTSSSTQTPLNSSSTYINNSSTEDEKDSYCSNMLKFEIPSIFE